MTENHHFSSVCDYLPTITPLCYVAPFQKDPILERKPLFFPMCLGKGLETTLNTNNSQLNNDTKVHTFALNNWRVIKGEQSRICYMLPFP